MEKFLQPLQLRPFSLFFKAQVVTLVVVKGLFSLAFLLEIRAVLDLRSIN